MPASARYSAPASICLNLRGNCAASPGMTGLDIHEGSVTLVGLEVHHSAVDGLAVMDLAHTFFSDTHDRPLGASRSSPQSKNSHGIRWAHATLPEHRASVRAAEAAFRGGSLAPAVGATRDPFNAVTSARASTRSIHTFPEQIACIKKGAMRDRQPRRPRCNGRCARPVAARAQRATGRFASCDGPEVDAEDRGLRIGEPPRRTRGRHAHQLSGPDRSRRGSTSGSDVSPTGPASFIHSFTRW